MREVAGAPRVLIPSRDDNGTYRSGPADSLPLLEAVVWEPPRDW